MRKIKRNKNKFNSKNITSNVSNISRYAFVLGLACTISLCSYNGVYAQVISDNLPVITNLGNNATATYVNSSDSTIVNVGTGAVSAGTLTSIDNSINAATPTSSKLNINLNAPGLSVINYNTFNIGESKTVNFNFNAANATALNKVTQTGVGYASKILGNMTQSGANANTGTVYLVNPNGVLFETSSIVNLRALAVSTLNIPDTLDTFYINSSNYKYFNATKNSNDAGIYVKNGAKFEGQTAESHSDALYMIGPGIFFEPGTTSVKSYTFNAVAVDGARIGTNEYGSLYSDPIVRNTSSTSPNTTTDGYYLTPSSVVPSNVNYYTGSGYTNGKTSAISLGANISTTYGNTRLMAYTNLTSAEANNLDQLVNLDGVIDSDSTTSNHSGNVYIYAENTNPSGSAAGITVSGTGQISDIYNLNLIADRLAFTSSSSTVLDSDNLNIQTPFKSDADRTIQLGSNATDSTSLNITNSMMNKISTAYLTLGSYSGSGAFNSDAPVTTNGGYLNLPAYIGPNSYYGMNPQLTIYSAGRDVTLNLNDSYIANNTRIQIGNNSSLAGNITLSTYDADINTNKALSLRDVNLYGSNVYITDGGAEGSLSSLGIYNLNVTASNDISIDCAASSIDMTGSSWSLAAGTTGTITLRDDINAYNNGYVTLSARTFDFDTSRIKLNGTPNVNLTDYNSDDIYFLNNSFTANTDLAKSNNYLELADLFTYSTIENYANSSGSSLPTFNSLTLNTGGSLYLDESINIGSTLNLSNSSFRLNKFNNMNPGTNNFIFKSGTGKNISMYLTQEIDMDSLFSANNFDFSQISTRGLTLSLTSDGNINYNYNNSNTTTNNKELYVNDSVSEHSTQLNGLSLYSNGTFTMASGSDSLALNALSLYVYDNTDPTPIKIYSDITTANGITIKYHNGMLINGNVSSTNNNSNINIYSDDLGMTTGAQTLLISGTGNISNPNGSINLIRTNNNDNNFNANYSVEYAVDLPKLYNTNHAEDANKVAVSAKTINIGSQPSYDTDNSSNYVTVSNATLKSNLNLYGGGTLTVTDLDSTSNGFKLGGGSSYTDVISITGKADRDIALGNLSGKDGITATSTGKLAVGGSISINDNTGTAGISLTGNGITFGSGSNTNDYISISSAGYALNINPGTGDLLIGDNANDNISIYTNSSYRNSAPITLIAGGTISGLGTVSLDSYSYYRIPNAITIGNSGYSQDINFNRLILSGSSSSINTTGNLIVTNLTTYNGNLNIGTSDNKTSSVDIGSTSYSNMNFGDIYSSGNVSLKNTYNYSSYGHINLNGDISAVGRITLQTPGTLTLASGKTVTSVSDATNNPNPVINLLADTLATSGRYYATNGSTGIITYGNSNSSSNVVLNSLPLIDTNLYHYDNLGVQTIGNITQTADVDFGNKIVSLNAGGYISSGNYLMTNFNSLTLDATGNITADIKDNLSRGVNIAGGNDIILTGKTDASTYSALKVNSVDDVTGNITLRGTGISFDPGMTELGSSSFNGNISLFADSFSGIDNDLVINTNGSVTLSTLIDHSKSFTDAGIISVYNTNFGSHISNVLLGDSSYTANISTLPANVNQNTTLVTTGSVNITNPTIASGKYLSVGTASTKASSATVTGTNVNLGNIYTTGNIDVTATNIALKDSSIYQYGTTGGSHFNVTADSTTGGAGSSITSGNTGNTVNISSKTNTYDIDSDLAKVVNYVQSTNSPTVKLGSASYTGNINVSGLDIKNNLTVSTTGAISLTNLTQNPVTQLTIDNATGASQASSVNVSSSGNLYFGDVLSSGYTKIAGNNINLNGNIESNGTIVLNAADKIASSFADKTISSNNNNILLDGKQLFTTNTGSKVVLDNNYHVLQAGTGSVIYTSDTNTKILVSGKTGSLADSEIVTANQTVIYDKLFQGVLTSDINNAPTVIVGSNNGANITLNDINLRSSILNGIQYDEAPIKLAFSTSGMITGTIRDSYNSTTGSNMSYLSVDRAYVNDTEGTYTGLGNHNQGDEAGSFSITNNSTHPYINQALYNKDNGLIPKVSDAEQDFGRQIADAGVDRNEVYKVIDEIKKVKNITVETPASTNSSSSEPTSSTGGTIIPSYIPPSSPSPSSANVQVSSNGTASVSGAGGLRGESGYTPSVSDSLTDLPSPVIIDTQIPGVQDTPPQMQNGIQPIGDTHSVPAQSQNSPSQSGDTTIAQPSGIPVNNNSVSNQQSVRNTGRTSGSLWDTIRSVFSR